MADNTGREREEELFNIIRSPRRLDDLNEADDGRYDPVMVPSLWVSPARAPGTASVLDSSVVFDLY